MGNFQHASTDVELRPLYAIDACDNSARVKPQANGTDRNGRKLNQGLNEIQGLQTAIAM
jgi:hypothetical protein